MSGSLQPHRLYNPWNSPGQNTGVGSHPISRGSSQPRDRTQVSCILQVDSLPAEPPFLHLVFLYYFVLFQKHTYVLVIILKCEFAFWHCLFQTVQCGEAQQPLCTLVSPSFLERPPFAWWAVQMKGTDVF